MRLQFRAALTMVLYVALTPAIFASGNANFIGGLKSLDEDFWTPVENHFVGGVNIDFGGKDWPINLVVGIFSSTDSDKPLLFGVKTAETEQRELSFGVIKVWDKLTHARPFISGGVSFIRLELERVPLPPDDDSSVGWFVNGGIFWQGDWGLNIGIDVRIVNGTEVTLLGVQGEADYVQVGLILGFGW